MAPTNRRLPQVNIADPTIKSSTYAHVADVHASSPRKRKAQGPPPTSQPPHLMSPSFSQGGSSTAVTPSGRRRGHSRQRSDNSSRGLDSYSRHTRSRRQSESVVSSQSGVSPTQQQGFETTAPESMSSARTGTRRTSTLDSRHSQLYERQPLPTGSEMKTEDRDSAERESSSGTSSKRDDPRL